MKIRITDIPAEGKSIEFELELEPFQERVNLKDNDVAASPPYVFEHAPHSQLKLELEGSTVLIRGQATGQCKTPCARCTEEAVVDLKVPVEMVLKRISGGTEEGPSEEDVAFGFYDGKEVDCAPYVEEALLLALPFAAFCKSDCKGLCPSCGKNLNLETCSCHEKKEGDPRFSVLRGLKVH